METKNKTWGILAGVIAVAAGVIVISFEGAMGIMLGIAGLIFGAVQIIKYFKQSEDSRNVLLVVLGGILFIVGVLILVMPNLTNTLFIFVQAVIAVWAGASGVIWLIRSFKDKQQTNPTIFIARIVLCLVMIAFAITLLVLAFAGTATLLAADRIVIGCSIIIYGLAQLFMLD